MYGDSDYTYCDERFLMTALSNRHGVHPKLIQYCMLTILQLRKRIIWPDLPKILSFNRKKYLLLYSSAKSIGKYPLSGTSPTLSFIQFLKFLTWYIYKKPPNIPQFEVTFICLQVKGNICFIFYFFSVSCLCDGSVHVIHFVFICTSAYMLKILFSCLLNR